jgi:hypothetical protein
VQKKKENSLFRLEWKKTRKKSEDENAKANIFKFKVIAAGRA